jgi:hypothetical protein
LAGLQAVATGRITESPRGVDLDLQIPPTALSDLEKWWPAVRGAALTGEAEARVRASGPLGDDRLPLMRGMIALRDVSFGGAGIPPITGITATLTLDGDSLHVPPTACTLGSSPITIEANGRNFADPVLELEAHAAQLRPSDLGAPGGGATDSLHDVRMQGEIRRAGADVKATFDSDEGRIASIDYEALHGDVSIRDKVLALNDVNLRALGGSMRGAARFKRRASATAFQMRAAFRDIALRALSASRPTAPATPIEGQLDADFELRGSGTDWATARDSMRGEGHVAIEDGTLQNVNVPQALISGMTEVGQLSELLSPRMRTAYPQLFGSDDTRFDEILASLAIVGGRMQTEDLAMRGPDYAIRAAGSLAGDLQLDLRARLLASEKLSGDLTAQAREVRHLTNEARRVEIPFRVRGTLSDIRPQLDAELVARALKGVIIADGLDDLLPQHLRAAPMPGLDSSGDELFEKALEDLLSR